MRYEKVLYLSQERVDEANRLLRSPTVKDIDSADVIKTYSVDFGDGYEADIKICNGEPTPWIDAVLFLDGQEIDCPGDSSDQILGSYDFVDRQDDHELHLEIRLEVPKGAGATLEQRDEKDPAPAST